MSNSVNQRDILHDSDHDSLLIENQSYEAMGKRSSLSEGDDIQCYYPNRAFSVDGWAGLDESTLQNIFLFLPLPSQLICTSICKQWNNVQNNPKLYKHQDLSPYGDVMRDKDYAYIVLHPRFQEIKSQSIAHCYDFPVALFLQLRLYLPSLEYVDVSNVVGQRPYLAEGLARLPNQRGFDSTLQNGGAGDETTEPGTLVEAVHVGRSIRSPLADQDSENPSIPVVSQYAAHKATLIANVKKEADDEANIVFMEDRCPFTSVSVLPMGEKTCIDTDRRVEMDVIARDKAVTKGALFAGLTWFQQCARTGRDAYAGTGVCDMLQDNFFDGTREEVPREPVVNGDDDNIFNFEEDTAFQNLPPVSNVYRANCTYRHHSSTRQECQGQVRGLVVWGLVNEAGQLVSREQTVRRVGSIPGGELCGIRKAYSVPLCATRQFCYCHSEQAGGLNSGFVCSKSSFCFFLPVALVYVCHAHRPEITADIRVYTCSMCTRLCSNQCDDGVVCYDCRLTSRKQQEWHFVGREMSAESNLMSLIGASSSIPIQQGVCVWKYSLTTNITNGMQINGGNWGWFEALRKRVMDAQAQIARNNERRLLTLSADRREGASIEMEGMYPRESDGHVYLDSDDDVSYEPPWQGIEPAVAVEEQISESEDEQVRPEGMLTGLLQAVQGPPSQVKPVLDRVRKRSMFWRAIASGNDIEVLIHPLPFTAGMHELCPPRTAAVLMWPLALLQIACALGSRAYDHLKEGEEIYLISPTAAVSRETTDQLIWPIILVAVAVYIVGFCLVRICRAGPAVLNALKMTVPFLYTLAAMVCGYIPVYCLSYEFNIPFDLISFLLILLLLSSSALIFFLPITHCVVKRAAVLSASFVFGSAYGWVVGVELAYVMLFFICLLDLFDSLQPQPRFPVVTAPHQALFPTPSKGAYPQVMQGPKVQVELRPLEYIWSILAFSLSLSFPTVTQIAVFQNILSVFLICTYVYPVVGQTPRPTPIIILTTAIILLQSPLQGNIQRAMTSAYTLEVNPPYMV